MTIRSYLGTGVTIIVLVLVIAMLVGQHLGQPIVLGFVVTGSMSPTLEPGDGFIAVPPALSGDIEEGDVITFDARELEGGGLTTHRVVGITDEGYITRGDANPFTDQDGPEPPVRDSQVVAVAAEFNGEVIVIPRVGSASMFLESGFRSVGGALGAIPGLGGLSDGDPGTVMIGAGVLLLLYSLISDIRGDTRRDRGGHSRTRRNTMSSVLILIVILLLITVPMTATMILPAGVNEITIISSQSPSQTPTVIERGTSAEFEYNVSNNGLIPLVAVIEPASTGVEIDETTHVLHRGETSTATATLHAPNETGAVIRGISERQYIRVLPTSVIMSLHEIHPMVAIAGINGVVIAIVTAIYIPFVGLHPLKLRDRDRNISLGDRIRSKIRKWR